MWGLQDIPREYLGQHSGALLGDAPAVQQPAHEAAQHEQLEGGADRGRQHAAVHTGVPQLPWVHKGVVCLIYASMVAKH